MPPNDLVLEAVIAAEYGESGLTWRNQRLAGGGPPHYRMPTKRARTYYSREEVAEFYKSFRVMPVITARRLEEEKRKAPAPA